MRRPVGRQRAGTLLVVTLLAVLGGGCRTASPQGGEQGPPPLPVTRSLTHPGVSSPGAPGEPHSTPDTRPSRPVVDWLVTDSSLPLVEPLIEGFKQSHPGWEVRLQRVRLSTGLAQGRAFLRGKLDAGEVDLVTAWPLIPVGELAAEGRLRPLDPWLNQDETLDPAHYGITDGLRVNGHLYDLPLTLRPLVMIYNAEQLAAAGVPMPGTHPLSARELVARVQTLAAAAEPGRWALSVGAPVLWLETTLGTPGLTREDPTPAVAYLRALATLSRVERGVLEAGPSPPAAASAFGEGLAALRIDLLPTLSEGGYPYEWGIAPPPGWSGEALPVPANWLPTVAVSAQAPHPEAAWTLVRYAAGAPGAESLASSGYLPAHRSPRALRLWLQATDRAPGAEWLASVPMRVVGRLQGPLERRREEALGLTVGEVLALRLKPEEGASRLQAAWHPPAPSP